MNGRLSAGIVVGEIVVFVDFRLHRFILSVVVAK